MLNLNRPQLTIDLEDDSVLQVVPLLPRVPLPFADWLSNARGSRVNSVRIIVAAVRHMAGVFYPDAELPASRPWLNRDHGTGGNRTGGRGKQRRLVNRQTPPWPRPWV